MHATTPGLYIGLYNYREESNYTVKEDVHLFYRSLRYAAYRQFTWWVYERLGKGNRRVIPSCVLWKIRNSFEESDDIYVPYCEGNRD